MSNTAFEAYLNRHENVLLELVNKTDTPAPIVKEAMAYALFPGGKRIRPLLVYLCGQMLQVPLNCLDIIAAAIELTHCYSLIHDDLPSMDNDDFRRGKPSCHRAFDEATAILVGDGMQALAIECLLTHLSNFLTAEQVIAITKVLLHASGFSGMVSGQSLDLTELTKPTLTESTLSQIHMLKTGKLIIACIEMILIAANLQDEQIKSFAKHLGLLFQMEDDYLDRYSIQTLGKERASDLANHKITFASLYTQGELFSLIEKKHFITVATLNHFKERADDLRILLDELFDRVSESNFAHES